MNYSFRNNLALWYVKNLHCSDYCGSIYLYVFYIVLYPLCKITFVVCVAPLILSLLSHSTGYQLLVQIRGQNLRTVFISQLLLLFQCCHVCKTDNPELEAKQVGTEGIITTSCSNPKCPKWINIWHSQPSMPNSQIPAGNFLLCMAVLLAGGSATKVFQV